MSYTVFFLVCFASLIVLCNTESCVMKKRCGDCVKDAKCGWCNGKCVAGNAKGPMQGSCTRYSYKSCSNAKHAVAQTQQETFCANYARLLNLQQIKLMETVIDAVVVRLVAPTSPVLIYFNGEKPPGSINFLDEINGGLLDILKAHLVQFFGQAGILGCDDPSFPAYQGNPNLRQVHEFMKITNPEFDYFNNQIIAVLNASGVVRDDLTTVLTLLQSTRTLIVQQSFCDFYASTLNVPQQALMEKVVDAVIQRLVAKDSPVAKYFNGVKPPGSLNYLDPNNAPLLTRLRNHIVQFFGAPFALSCTDPSFPPYAGNPDMALVHQHMGISDAEFDFFNNQVVAVCAGAGVSIRDQQFVLALLDTLRSAIVNDNAL